MEGITFGRLMSYRERKLRYFFRTSLWCVKPDCPGNPRYGPDVQSTQLQVTQLTPAPRVAKCSLIPIDSTSYRYVGAARSPMSPGPVADSRPAGSLTWCHEMNVCIILKFTCSNPDLQCGRSCREAEPS